MVRLPRSMQWPEWWQWEIELTPHVLRRMEDRDFAEVDLRAMLHSAESYRLDVLDHRWVITTRFRNATWRVIVEPDEEERILIVVTAYPAET